METKMNTELDLELTRLFEERSEDPCEHPAHEEEPRWHGGHGEWLLLRQHKGCNRTAQHLLVCDEFYRVLFSGRTLVRCMYCDEMGIDVDETYTVLGRKGVDF